MFRHKGGNSFTGSARGVWMNAGAIELTLILSFANSHAKYFASWFKPPKKNKQWN